jgi:hypothetical protein
MPDEWHATSSSCSRNSSASRLAARKESELSDTDVLSVVQDLEELGFLLPDKK